jgi:uncharacterized protein (DUF1697 family)
MVAFYPKSPQAPASEGSDPLLGHVRRRRAQVGVDAGSHHEPESRRRHEVSHAPRHGDRSGSIAVMPRQIVLLRGINLGRSRRVSMGELRALLSEAGHADVRTHLQSGNVVLRSEEPPERLRQLVEARLVAALGMNVQVVVRTRDELAEVIERNPLRDVFDDPKRLQVSFLSAPMAPDVVRKLEAADLAPEAIVVSGGEIYAWHPNGIQRSPLARMLSDRRLGVTATARNWATVTKLLELADS